MRSIYYWADGHWTFPQGLEFDRNKKLPFKQLQVLPAGKITDCEIYEIVANIVKPE